MIEIDVVSNNGVDEIRNIRDKVKYVLSELKYKVYIIDEVYMLIIGVFNVFLKILEEFLVYVIFILVMIELYKIFLIIIFRV